ncbi:major facilitator superfamily domain-containing protein 4A-like [Oppia nitens]|uniref:major facilitator superfamily domain-containing protein 4A-like n=1 Tax=Oppia nitens TaxID=1686743 RepID=UPI0023DB296C|nr:major facilitator superfamily domain-containing protein 4A-like [Oppia nitens]
MDNLEPPVPVRAPGKYHILMTTFALYFCYISYGLSYNIWGPTWVELVGLLNSTQKDMSYGNSLMAIGYTIGAFSGLFLHNHINRQLMVAFYLILMALSTSLTPVLKSYTVFMELSIIFGFGEGGFDTACNAWLLEMWLRDNGPYMQALHFMFGLGSLLAPLISIGFLSDTTTLPSVNNISVDIMQRQMSMKNMTLDAPQFGVHHHNYIYYNQIISSFEKQLTNISYETNNTSPEATDSRIYIPYCITGSLLATSAAIIIIMYLIKPYEPNCQYLGNINISGEPTVSSTRRISSLSSVTHTEERQSTDSLTQNLLHTSIDSKSIQDCSDDERPQLSGKYLISILITGSIMLCFYEGMENINFEYLSTFNVNTDLKLSEQTSDVIMSVMSASYTLGRGIGIILAIKVQPKYFLYTNFILISIGNLILYLSANTSEIWLYVGTVILGFGFSTVFPSIFSYMESRIRLTNTVCGILSVSCAIIATVDPIIVGQYISNYPYILLYVNIASIV